MRSITKNLLNNVLNVIIDTVMNVNDRNELFLSGNIDREDLWPKLEEYNKQALTFRFNFGLNELPTDPGVIIIRGPRQYGKSTWMEFAMEDTLHDFGKGTALFLNGDDIINEIELETKILELIRLFKKGAKVKRIFIDEISAINNWERAIKRLADRGELKDILLVTTGSKASDIRRGAERLPGRKGKLKRTNYIFTGISFKDFYSQCKRELGDDTVIAYLLSGGSPIAAKELWQMETIPDYFFELIRDWVLGEITRTGRSRQFLIALMRNLIKYGGNKLGFLKLARESGLANNTLAVEYIEQLSDLMSVASAQEWDHIREVPIQRKPCKFNFINLSVALAFYTYKVSCVHDFKHLPENEKAKWFEWLVAQELFRRQCVKGEDFPETINFWASKEHEIDFVDSKENLYEVKLGNSSPLEFNWFPKIFPNKKLLVINKNEFNSESIKGITMEQFLLADGFPHPYPGQVEDEDMFNEYCRF